MRKLTEAELENLAFVNETGEPVKPIPEPGPEQWMKEDLKSLVSGVTNQVVATQTLTKAIQNVGAAIQKVEDSTKAGTAAQTNDAKLNQRILLDLVVVLRDRLSILDDTTKILTDTLAKFPDLLAKLVPIPVKRTPETSWTVEVSDRDTNGFISKLRIEPDQK